MTFTNSKNKFIIALFLSVLTVPLYAQGNKPVALLKGQVTSTTGGNVADVRVSAFEGSTLSNTGNTNNEGNFQMILKSGLQ